MQCVCFSSPLFYMIFPYFADTEHNHGDDNEKCLIASDTEFPDGSEPCKDLRTDGRFISWIN